MKITQLHNDGSGATMTESSLTPPLPDDGDRVIVQVGKRPAVVVRHDRKGDAIFYVHDSRSSERFAEEMIRRWWPAAKAFDAPSSVEEMVARAVDGAYDQEARAAGYDSPLSYVMGLVAAIGTASFEELDAARTAKATAEAEGGEE